MAVVNFKINLWLQNIQVGLIITSPRDRYCDCYPEMDAFTFGILCLSSLGEVKLSSFVQRIVAFC